MSSGSGFHNLGPADENDLSPWVFVFGTSSSYLLFDLVGYVGFLILMSSHRYSGDSLFMAL